MRCGSFSVHTVAPQTLKHFFPPSSIFIRTEQVSGSPPGSYRVLALSPSPPASPCCRLESVAPVSFRFSRRVTFIASVTAVKVPRCRMCLTTSPTCWRKWHLLTKTLGKTVDGQCACFWQWDDTFCSSLSHCHCHCVCVCVCVWF